MIVLDTNVLSEALKQSPGEQVLRWLAEQDRDSIFTTTITQAELLYGVEMLPTGQRRNRLYAAVEQLFTDDFYRRVLPFDTSSAAMYSKVVTGRSRKGRPISQFDAIIASICRSHDATIATRNVSDFEDCGLVIINPWLDT